MSKIDFTLYGRSYCHLCDDMFQALLALCTDEQANGLFHGKYEIKQVDVDSDQELVAFYDELVPVLIGQKEGQSPVQLCHYFLDVLQVKAFLIT
ncbi:glutaredoxin family protein [Glaciimonas sp. PCH181]|uniref:glutaredoxin family protein n=1 Tax=Glaciimonas sp. PCH181 TaxID=2133943 RepID=UPI000D387982|nr:glutaredoxin family protein [Glaciimonas sp. PCH181]PUA20811.1 thioredoxin family protein [Glaciimonas sp. PCH181]